jgi:hypothetical protein
MLAYYETSPPHSSAGLPLFLPQLCHKQLQITFHLVGCHLLPCLQVPQLDQPITCPTPCILAATASKCELDCLNCSYVPSQLMHPLPCAALPHLQPQSTTDFCAPQNLRRNVTMFVSLCEKAFNCSTAEQTDASRHIS